MYTSRLAWPQLKDLCKLSRSAHWTPSFTNSEFFVYLFFFQIKIWKNIKIHPKMPIKLFILKRKTTLQHIRLGKLKFQIRKIGCLMTWTRKLTVNKQGQKNQQNVWGLWVFFVFDIEVWGHQIVSISFFRETYVVCLFFLILWM